MSEGFMGRAVGAYRRTGGRYETPLDDPGELLVVPTAVADVTLVDYSETRTRQHPPGSKTRPSSLKGEPKNRALSPSPRPTS